MKKLLFNTLNKSALRSTRYSSESGFTLLELAVIVIIIGALTAIAAPAWDAFVTRQRVRAVNNQVLQALQIAQAEAKRTKQDVDVEFEYNPGTVDPPTVTIDGNTQTLDLEGQIKEDMIEVLYPNGAAITFDYLGSVEDTGFEIVVSPKDGNSKRCVIVQTLLGAMRTAEDSECS